MGLGLTIACQIVERHGRRVWLESELRRGMTVVVRLPRQSNDSAFEPSLIRTVRSAA